MFVPVKRPPAVSVIRPYGLDRHEAIRDDISLRLRKVCDNLSDDEFKTFVETMLQVQLRGERRFA
jgi:hypothetical protein